MILIDGKIIAERMKDEIVAEIVEHGYDRPNLAIILVGEREDSKIYVKLKEKQAVEVGIDTHMYACDADIKESELISLIDFLNADESIDGILLQLPLPAGLNTDKIIDRINPSKDVDGFHPYNMERFLNSCDSGIEPPLVMVIGEIFKTIIFDFKDKRAVVLANSEIFGKTVKHYLECQGAKAEYYLDGDIEKKDLKKAEIVITALGKPQSVKGFDLNEYAIVIDIGISRLPDGKIVGDVDATSLDKFEGYITPVPGGVGPITIAAAFKNVLKLHLDNL